MAHIEIPEPVIKAVIDWSDSPDRVDRFGGRVVVYKVDVQVGGVTVMRRTYDNEYVTADGTRAYARPEYAENDEEACENAIAEFGRKIRDLIGEVQD